MKWSTFSSVFTAVASIAPAVATCPVADVSIIRHEGESIGSVHKVDNCECILFNRAE